MRCRSNVHNVIKKRNNSCFFPVTPTEEPPDRDEGAIWWPWSWIISWCAHSMGDCWKTASLRLWSAAAVLTPVCFILFMSDFRLNFESSHILMSAGDAVTEAERKASIEAWWRTLGLCGGWTLHPYDLLLEGVAVDMFGQVPEVSYSILLCVGEAVIMRGNGQSCIRTSDIARSKGRWVQLEAAVGVCFTRQTEGVFCPSGNSTADSNWLLTWICHQAVGL